MLPAILSPASPAVDPSPTLERARQLAQAELAALTQAAATWQADQPRTVLRATPLPEPGTWDLRVEPALFPPEGALLEWQDGGRKTATGTVERVAEDGQRVLARFLPTAEVVVAVGDTVRVDPLRLPTAVASALTRLRQPTAAATQWWGEAPVVREDATTARPFHLPADLDADQRDAVELVLTHPAAWVIGPAGTGKTRTLVATALAAAQRGEQVLITTTTNTALDEVLRRLVPLAAASGLLVGRGGDGGKDLPLMGLRLVAHWEVRRAAEQALQNAAPPPAPAALSVEQEAELRMREIQRGLPPFVGSTAERLQRLGDAVPVGLVPVSAPPVKAGHVLRLPIVAATTAWLALYGEAWLQRDCVLVDEAGMIPQPMAVLLSAQAKQRVAAFGDPNQLPPVVTVADAELAPALARHPFAMAEIAPPGQPDARRQVLRCQYRMEPAVASLLSDVFYGGVLESATPASEEAGLMARVGLIDSSGCAAQVRVNGRSRENPIQADLTASLVRDLLAGVDPTHQIAVITPFTAQMRLLRDRLPRHDPRLHIRTIHQLQGGEADTVVLDLCDGAPKAGIFLQESLNPPLRQLLCVALSRARQQCYVVVDEPFWRRMDGEQGGTIVAVADALRRNGVIAQPTHPGDVTWTPQAGLGGEWDVRWSAPWDQDWGA